MEQSPKGRRLEYLADEAPTNIDSQTRADYQKEDSSLEKARTTAELESLDQDRKERKKYAERSFWLVLVWLVAIGAFVFLQGVGKVGSWGFNLSNSVMLMLIGTTTVSVIGVFIIVANYLFPRR